MIKQAIEMTKQARLRAFIDIANGRQVMTSNKIEHCEACEQSGGFYTSGVPGILAHMKDGKVHPDAKPERCDACERFSSDAAAAAELQRLGLYSSD